MLDARRERAAARILEDERLRAHLTDDEFAPLLEWALARVDAAVRATADVADDEAADEIIGRELARLRDHLRTLDLLIGRRDTLSAEQYAARLDDLARAIPAPNLAAQRNAIVARRTESDGATLARTIAALLPAATESC